MKRIGFIDGRRMKFDDDFLLPFGTGEDVSIGWDGAALNILPLTDNVGTIVFGNGARDIDVRIFMGETWSHVLFDNSEQRVYFEAARIRLTGSTRLEFQSEDETIFSAAPGIMQIYALTQISFNCVLTNVLGVLRMDGSQRLQFQSADEAIFSAAPGIMQIYALTQIGFNCVLTNVLGVLRMDGSQRLQFQSADESIFSAAPGIMQIYALTQISVNTPLTVHMNTVRMDGSQQLHFFSDAARIYAGAVGKLVIQATSGDYDAIYISGNVRFMDGDIQMDLLPAANPGVVNRLWNNAGVLSVS